MKTSPIKSFTDLLAWQKSHQLVIVVYGTTKKFPEDEKFGLTNQLRRAAISVTSNIAEGFGRNNPKEKTQYYGMAYGSILEVQSQLLAARDIGYLSASDFPSIAQLAIEAAKLTSALRKANQNHSMSHPNIKYLKSKI